MVCLGVKGRSLLQGLVLLSEGNKICLHLLSAVARRSSVHMELILHGPQSSHGWRFVAVIEYFVLYVENSHADLKNACLVKRCE